MTIKEFKAIYKDFEGKDNMLQPDFEIEYSNEQPTEKFKNIEELFTYFSAEVAKWETIPNDKFPEELKPSRDFFSSTLEKIIKIVKDFVEANDYDEKSYDDLFLLFAYTLSVFTFDSKETNFLRLLNEIEPNSVETAFELLIGNDLPYNWVDDKSSVIGVINVTRFLAEKTNLFLNDTTTLKSDFQKINALGKKVVKDMEKLKEQLDIDSKQMSDKFEKANNQSQKNIEFSSQVFLTENQEAHKNLITSHSEKLIELEQAYRDKLMLEEPVKHWETRATELKSQALIWIGLTVGITLIGLVLFGSLMYSLSYENIAEQIKNPAISIRWSIISVFAVAIIVFLIRTFTKLAMSNYHLYRDAQERKHLTYLYLSLKTQGDIPDTDRQIILQSLFSRADTGLLKGESGPSMPNTPWDKFTNQGS